LARVVRVVALVSTKLVLSALRRSYLQLTHGYETEGAALRDEMPAMRDHLRSADLREGLAAFAAKRKPVFTGRWGELTWAPLRFARQRNHLRAVRVRATSEDEEGTFSGCARRTEICRRGSAAPVAPRTSGSASCPPPIRGVGGGAVRALFVQVSDVSLWRMTDRCNGFHIMR
jgi:hypothetical protein